MKEIVSQMIKTVRVADYFHNRPKANNCKTSIGVCVVYVCVSMHAFKYFLFLFCKYYLRNFFSSL